MQESLKNDERMIESFENDIRRDLDINEINKSIKQMEKQVGEKMPNENKITFVKNKFRSCLKANKSDKEFVEFFWNRMKDEILEQIN